MHTFCKARKMRLPGRAGILCRYQRSKKVGGGRRVEAERISGKRGMGEVREDGEGPPAKK